MLNIFQNSELGSFKTNSTDATMPYDEWHTGEASSSLNDMANDDFTQTLHINEPSIDDAASANQTDNAPRIECKTSLMLPVATIQMSASSCTANALFESNNATNSFLTVPSSSMKPSNSDVSISLLLDSEDSTESFDDDTFANANANLLEKPTRKRSNTNL